jgi:hypothetical protein
VAHLLRLGRSDATPGRPATAEALIPPSARSATGSSCGTTNCFGPGWPEARDPARWVNCGHAAQQDNRLGGGTRGRVPCPPTGDRAGQTERGWGQHCGCGPGSAAVRKCGRGGPLYREMPEKQRWALTAAQASRSTSTWQQLRHEVLELLRAGRSARCRPYNWLPGDGLGERWVMVDPAPLYPVLRRSDRRRAPASGRGAPGGLGGVRLATAGVG